MANYNSLKATIDAQIKANGVQAITGPILNAVLTAMINTLGTGYQYKGIATPATNPGTPDANVFYLASEAGTYTNFGGIVINEGEVCALVWNGTWTKQVTGIATAESVSQLGQKLIKLVAFTISQATLEIGDYYYNTSEKQIRQKTGASSAIVIPFYDGAVYTYNGHLYIWNGSDLVEPENDIIDNIKNGATVVRSSVPAWSEFTVNGAPLPKGTFIKNNSSFSILVAQEYSGGSYINRQDIGAGKSIVANSVKGLFKTMGTAGDVSLYYVLPIAEDIISEQNIQNNVVSSDKIKAGAITLEKMSLNSVSTETVVDDAITPEKISGEEFHSTNLYNRNDADCVNGKYVYQNNGELLSNDNHKASGWIPVMAGHKYIGKYIGQYAFYNASKVYISGGDGMNDAVIAPENASFLRITISWYASTDESAQLNNSESLLPFQPYFVKKKNLDLITSIDADSISNELISEIAKSVIDSEQMGIVKGRLWNGSIQNTATTLQNGGSLTLNDYPRSFKTGEIITLSAKITDFTGGITIGKGFTSYGSLYYQITDTQAILKSYDNSEHTIHTSSHGLTISDFIKVVLTFNDGKVKLLLQSLQDVFSEEISAENFNGVVKVESSGASLTDVELSATNSMLNKSIWAFGDSYFGITNPARELYYIKQWGYLNFLVQGFPGQASPAAYADLQRALAISKPKYLIWCLGMNDNSGLNDWKSYVLNVKALCDQYGITLILGTIPKPISSSYTYKDEMSAWIREESECRVLDVAKAVNSNANGHWYGYGTEYDYQSTDNVHPSSYGAKAIAGQFLIDVPEIMQ